MLAPKLTLKCTFDKLVQQLDITSVPKTPTHVHFYDRGASALMGMLPPKLPSKPYTRSGTFDILALPAELRTRIYQHALTHDLARGHIPNTALLRIHENVLGSTTALEVHYNLIQQWRTKYSNFTNALDLKSDGQPKAARLRLFQTRPRRTIVMNSLRTFGRGYFTALQLSIEQGVMVFSQRPENRLCGMLVTLKHVTRTIEIQHSLSDEEIDEREDEAIEAFTELVSSKSPL